MSAATERRWGRSPVHVHEHARAAALQAQHPGVIVWYGETSGHYYAMDADGLHEAPNLEALALRMWWHTHRPRPRHATTAPTGRRSSAATASRASTAHAGRPGRGAVARSRH
ncbi:hypothetical protein [Salinactinospora qingdaonensis]|uniref:Uncharacterized protein n=1 Tax=Salinactinospora qingdaonensis TaxID=702744 RepID=A0ABP7FDT6_9ACTN